MAEALAALRIQKRVVLCDECEEVVRVLDPLKAPFDSDEVFEFGGEFCEACSQAYDAGEDDGFE